MDPTDANDPSDRPWEKGGWGEDLKFRPQLSQTATLKLNFISCSCSRDRKDTVFDIRGPGFDSHQKPFHFTFIMISDGTSSQLKSASFPMSRAPPQLQNVLISCVVKSARLDSDSFAGPCSR